MTETPSHAEREVERARADLSDTLDALKEKLTFGQIFDEARTKFMGSDGGDFFRNLGRQARDNPMPAVLAGMSLLWMMMGSRERPQYGARTTFRAGDGSGLRTAAESARDTGAGAMERARHAATSAGETARHAATSVSESMRSMAERVGETVSSAGHAARSAGESAGGLMESAMGTAQDASRTVRQVGYQTRRTVTDMMEQQPLLVGAVGIALGAIVGAMLPRTRLEDEYLGETRDQLREAISEQTGQLYEKGKVTATEVYRAAAEEARAQGLVPEEGEGKTLAEKAEQVLTKAGEKAKEVGQREMGTGEMGASQAGRTASQAGNQLGTSAAGAAQQAGAKQTSGVQPAETIKPGTPVMPDRTPGRGS